MTTAREMAAYLARVIDLEEHERAGGYADYRNSPGFRPLSFTLLQPPCGCKIDGDGNLQSPLRVKFCLDHAGVHVDKVELVHSNDIKKPEPTEMLLWCPKCNERHIDEGEFATKEHHTHACQSCGMVWRPAIVPTIGVRFLPGFKST